MVLAAGATGIDRRPYCCTTCGGSCRASMPLIGADSRAVQRRAVLLARPHLLAWPCLALWCGGLVTARANRIAPSFALLPVMLLWVNLHGSFMLGLLLPGAFMIEAAARLRDADHHRVFMSWAGFILAAWAVALLNPDFLAGVLFPIRSGRHEESRLDR